MKLSTLIPWILLAAFLVQGNSCTDGTQTLQGSTTSTLEVTQVEFDVKVEGGVLYLRETGVGSDFCMSFPNVGITYAPGWKTIQALDTERVASGLAPYTNVELDACIN